jgi:hypothetical protein
MFKKLKLINEMILGFRASGDHLPKTGTDIDGSSVGDRIDANVIKTLLG